MELIDQFTSFFSSPLFGWILKGGLMYLGVLWFSMVLWVTRDVINRSNSVIFQTLVILTNLALPVFGLLLYLIIRPTKTLTEKYYEELEYHFLTDHQDEKESCPRCEKVIQKEYLFCPHCEEKLKKSCHSCESVYLNDYQVCPYCGEKEKSEQRKQRALKSGKKTDKKAHEKTVVEK